MSLFEHICKRVQHGAIPFSEFMQEALYAPNLGYYTAGLQKLGPGGDFITAPELTPLFGKTLANQCQQVLVELDAPIVFEFGAGSGRLCVDLLTHLEHLNSLPFEYHILEVSSNLRHRQEELIQLEIPHLANKIRWLSTWPAQPFNGVVIANEVLDAMPVERFLQTSDGLLDSYVALNEEAYQFLLANIEKGLRTGNPSSALRAPSPHVWGEGNNEEGLLEKGLRTGSPSSALRAPSPHVWGEGNNEEGLLREVFKPSTNPRLLAHVQTVLPPDLFPYQSEANLFIDDWLQQCHAMLNKGAVFLLDYGFPRHEYYHPDRHHGTLMCHYRHLAHTNPLIHIGEQDITAHVDFTHVADAAVAAGFHVAGYTNQASFLLSNGLLNCLAEIVDERERVNSQQAVKQLIQPNEMGELFKVIALTKQLDLALNGFQLHDKRVSL